MHPEQPALEDITNHELLETTPEPTRYTPQNFNLGVINGILYFLAEILMDPTLVLVAFLTNLNAPPLLLGAVLPIRDGMTSLPQLWVSGFLQSWPKKMRLYNIMTYFRITIWVCLFLSITFVSNPFLLLILFFVFYSLVNFATGVNSLAFLEVVAKTVPPRRRGEFFAWRFGMSGLIGIAASLSVRYLLDPANGWKFPHNFSLLSGLYLLLATTAILLYTRVDEPPDVVILPQRSFAYQFARSWQILKANLTYRRYLVMQSTLLIANAATPFFAVYVIQRLGVSQGMIGVYLAATITANLLGNLLFAWISLNFGNHKVMVIASIAGVCMSALVIVLVILAPRLPNAATIASIWLIPVFALSGLRTTGIGVSGNSLLLDLSPVTERSIYIGFTNTILGIVLLLSALGGLVYAAWGFIVLLIISLVAHLLALNFGLRLDISR